MRAPQGTGSFAEVIEQRASAVVCWQIAMKLGQFDDASCLRSFSVSVISFCISSAALKG